MNQSEYISDSDHNDDDEDYHPNEEEIKSKKFKKIFEKYDENQLQRIYNHYQKVKKKKLVSTVKKFSSIKLTINDIYAIIRYFESDKSQ